MTWLTMNKPLNSEIWMIRLDPTQGREQAKTRPCVIISNNIFNKGPADLVIAIPLTSKNKQNRLHIKISPENSGLSLVSFAMPEQIRSVSTQRCVKRMGSVTAAVMQALEIKINTIFDFS